MQHFTVNCCTCILEFGGLSRWDNILELARISFEDFLELTLVGKHQLLSRFRET